MNSDIIKSLINSRYVNNLQNLIINNCAYFNDNFLDRFVKATNLSPHFDFERILLFNSHLTNRNFLISLDDNNLPLFFNNSEVNLTKLNYNDY